MRLLYVSAEYPPDTAWGGIGTYVRFMARALAARGHEVHVLSVSPGIRPRDDVDDGVHVHRRSPPTAAVPSRLAEITHMTKAWTRLEGALAVRHAARALGMRFDVAEIPDWNAEGRFLDRSQVRAVVVQLHAPLRLLAQWSRVRRTPDYWMSVWLEGGPLRRADALVSPTRALAEAVARSYHLDMQRIAVIPLPVEMAERVQIVDGQTPPGVLFVGRIDALKNPRVIVRAVPSVLQRVPDAEFAFVGRPDQGYARELHTLADRLHVAHAVRFLGPLGRGDVEALRARSRLCVVPSRFENFPYAVAEAMAQARPVVASAVGGIPEMVQDGVTGYLVDPDDPDQWADRMAALLADPPLAGAMGRQGRDIAWSRFHPRHVAAEKEALFSAFLKG